MSWTGEDAWVKISDSVNTALSDDSSALTSGAGPAVPGVPRSADGIGYAGS
jgi:hypothetical protein